MQRRMKRGEEALYRTLALCVGWKKARITRPLNNNNVTRRLPIDFHPSLDNASNPTNNRPNANFHAPMTNDVPPNSPPQNTTRKQRDAPSQVPSSDLPL